MSTGSIRPPDDDYNFTILDSVYHEASNHPYEEHRYYHVWNVAITYLNLLAFRHAEGKNMLTTAPQWTFKGPTIKRHFHANMVDSRQTISVSQEQFDEGVLTSATASSPIGRRGTRNSQNSVLGGSLLPLPPLKLALERLSDVVHEENSITRRSKRKVPDFGEDLVQMEENDFVVDEVDALSSADTSLQSDLPAFPPEDTELSRRTPDFTMFQHGHGPTGYKALVPAILVENKPAPNRMDDSVGLPSTLWALHNTPEVKDRVSTYVYDTRKQAKEQLHCMFSDYECVNEVTYIYAIGFFYIAYRVTREDYMQDNIPPLHYPEMHEVQYLFAKPPAILADTNGAEEVHHGSEPPTRDGQHVIFRELNPHLIQLWNEAIMRN